MSNLFASLGTASNALRAFQKQIAMSQANVANELTPGYARQTVPLESLPFDDVSMSGGVRAGAVQSSRNLLAEEAVRRQLSSFGQFTQQAESLADIEAVFDVSGQSGLVASLQGLFDAFSELAQAPNSTTARQAVIDAAADVAQSFNRTAGALQSAAADLDVRLRNTITDINDLAEQVRSYNVAIMDVGEANPGTEAAAFAAAEALSQHIGIKVFQEKDGTLTLLAGGQAPLVKGRDRSELSLGFTTPAGSTYPGARPIAQILDGNGQDISAMITSGGLRGLLDVREQTLPGLLGNVQQEGDLNVLARSFADRVNTLLTGGVVSQGPPPVAGAPLFAYDAGQPTAAAATLTLDPAITPAGLATISPGPPAVANGIALDLAELRSSTNPPDQINGVGYLQFFGAMGGRVGSAVNGARAAAARAEVMTTHARDLRQQLSGVSLDQEAVDLMQAQRSFEASSRVVTVVDELLQSVLGLIR